MPIRFSTQAANADKIDPDRGDAAAGLTADRGQVQSKVDSQAVGRDEAKPGEDILAAGFLKDKDSSKP
ncbi:MAG: hypothetical protein ABIU58_12615 [Ramlibacter sp.]